MGLRMQPHSGHAPSFVKPQEPTSDKRSRNSGPRHARVTTEWNLLCWFLVSPLHLCWRWGWQELFWGVFCGLRYQPNGSINPRPFGRPKEPFGMTSCPPTGWRHRAAMAMNRGLRYGLAPVTLLLVFCATAPPMPSRPRSLPPRPANTSAPSLPANAGRERQRRTPKGKRSKNIQHPPRRCAALINGRTQCPGNAVEPTDYCARHQKPAPRSRPQE